LSIQYVLIGLLSFVFLAGADWATYKEIRYLKAVLWVSVIPLSLYATVMAWVDTARFAFPEVLSMLAWFPLVVFFALFLYSLYFEIPFRKTYVGREQPKRVVTGGTYTLTRHPAFIWFIIWIVSSVLASRSVTLLVAAPVWITAYIVCMCIEDKLTSRGHFAEEYREYQRETPMLIPTRRSIRRFAVNSKHLFRSKTRNRVN
jgi:protein-S-isoprenylcysteine O-methyltransferase Ste14